jgi:hypothetical protein
MTGKGTGALQTAQNAISDAASLPGRAAATTVGAVADYAGTRAGGGTYEVGPERVRELGKSLGQVGGSPAESVARSPMNVVPFAPQLGVGANIALNAAGQVASNIKPQTEDPLMDIALSNAMPATYIGPKGIARLRALGRDVQTEYNPVYRHDQAWVGDEGLSGLSQLQGAESEFMTSKPLSEVIQHPELFEAYPELKNIRYSHNMSVDEGTYLPGRYSKNYTPKIDLSHPPKQSTMIHEIQHAVQDLEGDLGANIQRPNDFRSYLASPSEIEARYSTTKNTDPDIGPWWNDAEVNDPYIYEKGAKRLNAGDISPEKMRKRYLFERYLDQHQDKVKDVRDLYDRSKAYPAEFDTDAKILEQLNKIDPITAESIRKSTIGGVAKNKIGNVHRSFTAYHGSPFLFGRVKDAAKTGETGFGMQAFGHGFYATGEKEIGAEYAKIIANSKNQAIANQPTLVWMKPEYAGFKGVGMIHADELPGEVHDALIYGKDVEKVREAARLHIAANPKDPINPRLEKIIKHDTFIQKPLKPNTYTLSIHKGKTPDQYTYMKWEDPVPDKLKLKIISDFKDDVIPGRESMSTQTGQDMYRYVSARLGSDKAASEYLLSKGVDGIRYKHSRYAPLGTKYKNTENYVIFDPRAVTIESQETSGTIGSINKRK